MTFKLKWGVRTPGVTILEIIFAVLIMGLLIAFIAPRVNQALQNAKKTTARSAIQGLVVHIETFASDVGTLPSSLNDLVEPPSGATGWSGPYCSAKELKDPWLRDFQYQLTPGGTKQFELFSWGPQGESGPESSRVRTD